MRTVRLTALLAMAAAALLSACGGGGSGSSTGTTTPPATVPVVPLAAQPASCSVADQQAWLLAYMRDQYLWYAQMPAGDPAGGVSAYFSSLLFRPLDRYSYVQAASDFSQTFSAGTRTGYGYSLTFVDSTLSVLRVRQIEPDSPAEAAGLRRGDYILHIDGYTPQQIAAGAAGRVSTDGVRRSFGVRGIDGQERQLNAVSATFALQPAQGERVWTAGTGSGVGKVGYLAYHQFIGAGQAGLHRAFSQFAREGIRELVLDLRYNGGGSVDLARGLASMIGGVGLAGQTFTELRYNDRHPEYNEAIRFTVDPSALAGPPLTGLRRVVVIATRETASASEMLINALSPFLDVVVVGTATYGKPFGFLPVEACGTVFNAVNFEAVNARGQGGYVNGIAATCAASDDLDHALGDPAETSVATALEYLRTGACPQPPAAARRSVHTPAPGSEGSGVGMWRH